MAYKLFLDDTRELPSPDWEVVRNFEQFKKIITSNGLPSLVSFDYDLTMDFRDKKTKTGLACAVWMQEFIVARNLRCPDFKVHSQNHSGAKRIKESMTSFINYQNR